MEQSTKGLHINFDKIKVRNEEKVSLKLLMQYMQDVIILFQNIGNEQKTHTIRKCI